MQAPLHMHPAALLEEEQLLAADPPSATAQQLRMCLLRGTTLPDSFLYKYVGRLQTLDLLPNQRMVGSPEAAHKHGMVAVTSNCLIAVLVEVGTSTQTVPRKHLLAA